MENELKNLNQQLNVENSNQLVPANDDKSELAEVNNIADLACLTAKSAFTEIDESDFGKIDNLELQNEVSLIRAQGGFVPINNTVVIHRFSSGAALLAKRHCSTGGKKEIRIIFAYKEGTCSDEITISNADFFQAKTILFNGNDKETVIAARKSLRKIGALISPYWDTDTEITAHELVAVLVANYDKIPNINEYEITADDAYAFMVNYIEKNLIFYPWMVRRQYYAIDDTILERIADQLKRKPIEILKILDSAGMLHHQKEMKGYQCKVTSLNDNFYCLKMLKSREGKIPVEDFNYKDLL